MLAAGLPATGQNYPNGLSMDSVDPQGDALFIKQVRAKMTRIRRDEQRPTVALVLSGGGAKGAAQVGVLKYLEEMDMPVDMVLGTSIGGLLGGLYAVGYRSEDLSALFTTQDWSTILSDAIPQSYIPYTTKMNHAKYVLTIPFHNAEEVLEEKHAKQHGSLVSSLPSGYANGFNVNNLLSSLTVGYHDSLAFRDLPTPYVCVATDLVSNKAKNWGAGQLKTAMRSTMSIPGLFNPVRTGGMILVDGGTRNNFPADIAKAMGADIIIGIELSDLKAGYDEINNIGDIASQFINMLGKDAFDKNVNIPDVLIKPVISEFNMLSFNQTAVDTMIVRGYRAAELKRDELLAIRRRLGKAVPKKDTDRAVNIAETGVQIKSIEFRGVTDNESRLLAHMLPFRAGDVVDKAAVDDAMCRLQATGAFASITYSMLGSEAPFALVFDCATAPTHTLSFGFRMDTVEWASMLFNLGLNTNRLTGSKFNVTAKLGQNLKAGVHYSYNLPGLPTINFDGTVVRYKGSLTSQSGGEGVMVEAPLWGHKETFYLTNVNWSRANFKLGLKNEYYSFRRNSYLGALIEAIAGQRALKGDYIGAFAQGHWYSFDDHYYPSRGSSVSFSINYDFIQTGVPSYTPVLSFGLDYKKVFPLGERLAIIPDLHFRNIINNGSYTDDYGLDIKHWSIMHINVVGGDFPGRYVEQQVPFFGINHTILASDYLASAVLELRCNPYKKFYVSALAGALESSSAIDTFITGFDPDCAAFGLELGYNFIGGPVKLQGHWSKAYRWGIYAAIGFDF